MCRSCFYLIFHKHGKIELSMKVSTYLTKRFSLSTRERIKRVN
ncbi:hypothetical protein LPICM02_230106 [Pseudolactococcus piscium]|nr:hypothetical protein LPICM02_230106 [Lactococcus piscium]